MVVEGVPVAGFSYVVIHKDHEDVRITRSYYTQEFHSLDDGIGFDGAIHYLWQGEILDGDDDCDLHEWNDYTGPVVIGQRIVYVPEYDVWVEWSN